MTIKVEDTDFCKQERKNSGVGNAQKLELLNKQALRLISDDNNNTFETLLNNLNMTTSNTKHFML